MVTTLDVKLAEMHDQAIKLARDYGDNDPSDPEQADLEDNGL